MPTDLELEQAWEELQAALNRMADDPCAENRARLSGASRSLAALWRLEREALDALVHGSQIQLVFGAA